MKELKFGETGWFRTRGGEVVFICRMALKDSPCVLAGSDANGTVDYWASDGRFMATGSHALDIVEHLPECTGFDWQPEPKYVPWTFETMPMGVKVKNDLSGIKMIAVPVSLSDAILIPSDRRVSYADLLNEYGQIDGSPCGVPQ